MGKVPNIPHWVDTPCRNEEVSGHRLPNGEVIDLWFGDSGSNNPKHVLPTYREAAKLCWSVCAVETPDAFEACALYQQKEQPDYGVYGGVIPEVY